MRLPGVLLALLLGATLAFASGHSGGYVNGFNLTPAATPGLMRVSYTDTNGQPATEVVPCKNTKNGDIKSAPPFEINHRRYRVSRAHGLQEHTGTNPAGQEQWSSIPEEEELGRSSGEDGGTLPA